MIELTDDELEAIMDMYESLIDVFGGYGCEHEESAHVKITKEIINRNEAKALNKSKTPKLK